MRTRLSTLSQRHRGRSDALARAACMASGDWQACLAAHAAGRCSACKRGAAKLTAAARRPAGSGAR